MKMDKLHNCNFNNNYFLDNEDNFYDYLFFKFINKDSLDNTFYVKEVNKKEEVADSFWYVAILDRVLELNLEIPKTNGIKVLFPASAVGRKGAYEIRRLAKELNLNLTISGRTVENDNFWDDLKTEKFNGAFDQIGLIVYPTFIEHQPRQILKAISKGVTVVTTTACGLDGSDLVEIVEINNFEQLKNAVEKRTEKKH
jgi:hypothetical protein